MDRAVLLVDDDENLLLGLVRALHKQPFQVHIARNSEEAIRLLKTRDIDVIVADERMPGMSGVQLLSWVADNRPDAMRILLTAHAQTETAIRAINDVGLYRFLRKPCNEARLAVTIHEALEQKTALEEGRRTLESKRRQLHELERLGQDVKLQTRVASQDLQRLIERILDCCHRLEEHSGRGLDSDSHALLADARKAAGEARRLVLQLQTAAGPTQTSQHQEGTIKNGGDSDGAATPFSSATAIAPHPRGFIDNETLDEPPRLSPTAAR